MNKKYCLALDLKDDEELIKKYKWHHAPENQWPEINVNIRAAGVVNMEIYLFGNRMFMIMEVDESFSFERMDEINQNPKSVEWENLMWNFQQAIPGAKPGEKWVLMEQVFKLP
ncbi:L-rhamnose mutarotase [Arcticibacterium luteifluviistationis]|uniref:L-fucose mutarotase n=1 Tax=Arcticibacterium luteifluviistationis TaxID=1784714 RepID=A0A2Z4G6J8_9BACT|nr:L-rhamnose mutarotase [Arcticibacterium luteifluviistationis]AWV96772.1 L-fucose mutarotase [Arcticibacterium luteifluviistationis]